MSSRDQVGGSSESEGEIFSSASAAEDLSSRDLSPVDMVREYIQDFSGEMVEDFERICARVSNVRDEAVAKGASLVHRTAQGGAELCHDVYQGGADIVLASRL